MDFMPIFGLLGSFIGGGGGGDDDRQAPAPVEERPVAGKASDVPQTPGQEQRAAVRDSRKDQGISGSSLTTRSGVNIVGGA